MFYQRITALTGFVPECQEATDQSLSHTPQPHTTEFPAGFSGFSNSQLLLKVTASSQSVLHMGPILVFDYKLIVQLKLRIPDIF